MKPLFSKSEISWAETVVEISIMVGHRYNDIREAINDSMEVNSLCIQWANEFEKLHENTDWDTTDWIDTVITFAEQKIKEVLKDATGSQVSENPIISDELRADLKGKWNDIHCLAYSFNRLNDGRAEQWQLFVTPTTDYLMLDDGGEIGEYIYFTEEDLRKDIAAMEELKESFTEI